MILVFLAMPSLPQLKLPRIVATFRQSQRPLLEVAPPHSHDADPLVARRELGVRGRTRLLEGSLLLVNRHPASRQSPFVP